MVAYYCKQCGNPVDEHDAFCSSCGAPIPHDQATDNATVEEVNSPTKKASTSSDTSLDEEASLQEPITETSAETDKPAEKHDTSENAEIQTPADEQIVTGNNPTTLIGDKTTVITDGTMVIPVSADDSSGASTVIADQTMVISEANESPLDATTIIADETTTIPTTADSQSSATSVIASDKTDQPSEAVSEPSKDTADPTTLLPGETTVIESQTSTETASVKKSDEQPYDPLAGFSVMTDMIYGDTAQNDPTPPMPIASAPVATPTFIASPMPPENVESATESDEATPPKKKHTKAIIAAIVVGILLLATAVGVFLWFQYDSAEKARREPHPVPLTIVAEGYTDECTKIPLQIKGTDIDGNEIDDAYFVNASGKGLELVKGSYELTFPASPLTTNGVLYYPPAISATLEIGNDLANGETVDTSGLGTITFTRSSALDETGEMIDNAYNWAIKDESQKEKAQELKTKALDVHNSAIAANEAKIAEEAAARRAAEALAARTISNDYYSFVIPESWVGNVIVNKDGNNVVIYPKGGSSSTPMIYINVVTSNTYEPAGDPSGGYLRQELLKNGHAVRLGWKNYVDCISTNSKAESATVLDLGVQLESGGQLNAAGVRTSVQKVGNPSEAQKVVSDWMITNVASALSVK